MFPCFHSGWGTLLLTEGVVLTQARPMLMGHIAPVELDFRFRENDKTLT